MLFDVANAESMGIILSANSDKIDARLKIFGLKKGGRMEKRYLRIIGLVILVFAAGLMMGSISVAGEKKDMKGWEIDSPYNQNYDVKEYEKYRAWALPL